MSDLVNLQFEHHTGRIITVALSRADAENAQNDMAFAQSVMEAAMAAYDTPLHNTPQLLEQHQQQAQAKPSQMSSSCSSSASVCSGDTSTSDESSAFKWPHAVILLLIDTFKSYERDLVGGKLSQKKTWDRIAATLGEYGHSVTGLQCMSKFNGMKRTFKTISDHNCKSGNNPRTWPYYELMQSLLGDRPFMVPLALASSSKGASARSRNDSDSSLERSCEPPEATPRKRRASDAMNDVTSAIIESKRISEEGRNRRHQEKMAKTDALLPKLDRLIEKM